MEISKLNFLENDYTIKLWNGEHLGKLIGCDTETDLADFTGTPNLACIGAYAGGDDIFFIKVEDITLFFNTHHDSKFIWTNAPFDMDVLQKQGITKRRINTWYDNDQILDNGILYRLSYLAEEGYVPFKYNLGLLAETFLGAELDKEGDTRITYGQYIGQCPSKMSKEHIKYFGEDLVVTYSVWLALVARVNSLGLGHSLLSHDIQVKGDYALNHIYKNGIGFDLKARDEWLEKKDKELENYALRLSQYGWVRGSKGVAQKFEDACDFLDISHQLPRTKEGKLSSKESDLEYFRHHPFIDDYIGYAKLEKTTSFVRDMMTSRIHPRYTSILNTGRTSCRKPNIQQIPREGGIREMFVPKEGHVFIDVDYSTVELATLAQVLYNRYGHSVMRDKINEGVDLHRYYASVMNECKVEDVTKQQRQEAKAANFGFPGGLGIDTFITFAKGYGLTLDRDKAQAMKDAWFEAFPEVAEYLKDEQGYVVTETGRVRGNTFYCAEKNTPFQGLAADGLKLAMYDLDKLGFNIVAEVHDQVVVEVKKDMADTYKLVIEDNMVKSMKKVVPDVNISVEGQILERWCK